MLFIFVCFDFLARTLFLPQQKPDIFVSVLALYSFERGRVALTQKFEGQQVEIVVLFFTGPASESMCDFFLLVKFFAQEVIRVVALCCADDFNCTSIRKEFVFSCSMGMGCMLQLLADRPSALF